MPFVSLRNGAVIAVFLGVLFRCFVLLRVPRRPFQVVLYISGHLAILRQRT